MPSCRYIILPGCFMEGTEFYAKALKDVFYTYLRPLRGQW